MGAAGLWIRKPFNEYFWTVFRAIVTLSCTS